MSVLEQGQRFWITEADLHSHLRARMHQRGITREEIERVLNEGWKATDAKPGTLGKVMVFSCEAELTVLSGERGDSVLQTDWRGTHLVDGEGPIWARFSRGDK
jgi:hypothetical protein